MDEFEVVIVGGGVAGLEAAYQLGSLGIQVLLVEKETQCGGQVKNFKQLFPELNDGLALCEELASRLKKYKQITILTGSMVDAIDRSVNGFKVSVITETETLQKTAQAVILATGYELFDAVKYGEYGYGRYPGVITGLEFEQHAAEILSKSLKTVFFVKCVGARDRSKGAAYCSKICCMYTAKQAMEVKQALPNAEVYVSYMDIRSNVRQGEEFVRGVIENEKVKYIRGRAAKVFPCNDKLVVRAEDTLMGIPIEIQADLVVLAAAMVPRSLTVQLARSIGASLDEYGFVLPQPDSNTLQCTAEGVYFAGTCGFPSDVKDSRLQGQAAAMEVLAYLAARKEGP